jgi:MotA/TolQ/ExbB proton channel family
VKLTDRRGHQEDEKQVTAIIDFLLGAPVIIQVVAGILLFLVALFIVRFVIPAVFIWFQLRGLVRRLRRLQGAVDTDLTPVFPRGKTLTHLWTEYRDTLHEQRVFDPITGTFKPTVLRSTVPAAMVFTSEALVDSRIATEFFKHLPGLFTGVGIIGTFWGLIQGLQAFKVSEDAAVVRTSLEGLMHRVSDAFLVSAAAIFAAMVATFLEKFLVTALYRKTENIAVELDSMFQSGAGEEYLARLVKASEDSADQSKILKDALVTDLERILSSLTERQIQAQAQGSQDLAKQFMEGITVGLQGPLERIAQTFQQTSQGNSQAVSELLTDVLAGFSQRLQELFGGQITGINQLQQQTIQALQAAVAKIDQMASAVETAGTRSSDAMGQRLADAMGAMESRQNLMNERMTEFVEQIRNLVHDSQSATNQKLQTTLAEIGEAVRSQISALKEQGDQASASHAEREGHVAEQTQEMLRQLGSQVSAVVGSLQAESEKATTAQFEREHRMAAQADDTVAKLAALTEGLMLDVREITGEVRGVVEAMRSVTSDSISRMNSGAETLFLAADEFAKAGQGVAGVLQQATGVSTKLAEAAGSVSASSTMLQGVVADYAMTRETFASMLADLRGTVENAKREANLTSDVLARIESASQKLGQAQQDAEDYLAGISDVLARAHAEFAEGLKTVLGEGHREFYERLSNATGLLRQAIEELASTVEPTMQRV